MVNVIMDRDIAAALEDKTVPSYPYALRGRFLSDSESKYFLNTDKRLHAWSRSISED